MNAASVVRRSSAASTCCCVMPVEFVVLAVTHGRSVGSTWAPVSMVHHQIAYQEHL